MRIAIRVIGVLLLLIWLIGVFVFVRGLLRTDEMSGNYAWMVPREGYSFDVTKWKSHWVFYNAYIVVCCLLGCVGSVLLMRAQRRGFLLMAGAVVLWFLLPIGLRVLGLSAYGYEFVSLRSNLSLLAWGVAFALAFVALRRLGAPSAP